MNKLLLSRNIFFALSVLLVPVGIIRGDTLNNNNTNIRGTQIEGYVSEYINTLFTPKKLSQRDDKAVTQTKKRIVEQFSRECDACQYQWQKNIFFQNGGVYELACRRTAINMTANAEAKKLIEALAWDIAQTITRNPNIASDVAKEIGNDVQTILNSRSYVQGMLDSFIGSNLEQKVQRYCTNMKNSRQEKKEREAQNVRQKAQDYATLYFYPHNDNININNLGAAYKAINLYDQRIVGNINAIVNIALDNLSMSNPNSNDIKNAILDAVPKFLSKTAYNYAKSMNCTDNEARQVEEQIRKQITNRINSQYLRDAGLDATKKGQLKGYIGEKLENEVKAIISDIKRNR